MVSKTDMRMFEEYIYVRIFEDDVEEYKYFLRK